eukprot:TRINITY_DN2701_c0_g1_i1.p2 TRINITY_DN2701_c0_g1~~TRINITY_DN2701_c0_g1_i1.p2  ORF type:complete len:116 (-),score=21.75 TRINITY_DN2701_c0_g1_i1:107-454(-)
MHRRRHKDTDRETSTTKAIESPPLPLESIDNIHSSHSLPPGMLCVGHSISDDIFQKDLQDPASLLIDEAADALHAPSACESSDGGLRDSLDVVPQDFPVPLRSSLAQPLSSLSTA